MSQFAGTQVTRQAEEENESFFNCLRYLIYFVQQNDNSDPPVVRRRPVSTLRNGHDRHPNLFVLEHALLPDALFIGRTRNDRPVARRMQSFPFAFLLQCVFSLKTRDEIDDIASFHTQR